jgi:homoserine kinase type II
MVRVPEPNNEPFVKTIRAVVEENYDLGKLTRVKEMLGGYCNKSYAVWLSANDDSHRYLLRLYNPNVIESEILFEHALLNHLICNGFTLAPAIVLCRNKATVVHSPPPANHRGTKAFWALFEFLEGEDKYSWTDTDLTDNEFTRAAEILAHFHHCGHGFKKPPGADRAQPPIMEFMPTFKKTFSAFLKRADDRRCDRLFKDNFELICKALDTAASFETRFQGMPQIPIHCDYHPGNLKFRNEEVVGLFDLDWSKIDYRLFDVALSLVYFTSIWDEKAAGLRPDKFTLFLGKYNQACQRLAHNRPLSNQERRCLVPMMSIANLYVLNWDLVDFYHTSQQDDDAYYTFIDHNIGLNHWIARNKDQIERWTKNALN